LNSGGRLVLKIDARREARGREELIFDGKYKVAAIPCLRKE